MNGMILSRSTGTHARRTAVGALVAFLFAGGAIAHAQTPYVRGDTSGDGIVDITDVTSYVTYYFQGAASTAASMEAYDVNGDGARSLTDLIHLSRHLFLNGDPIPAPFPSPGTVPPPVVPDREDFVTFQIEDGVAAPGGSVTIPVYMTYKPHLSPPPPVASYTVGVEFNASDLKLSSITIPPTIAALNPELAHPMIRTGEARLTVLFDARRIDVGLAPADNLPIALLHFDVDSSTTNTETEIRITDTVFAGTSASASDRSLYTEASIGGRMVRPRRIRGRIFIDQSLSFVRGDISRDGLLDITDMVQLLRALSMTGDLLGEHAAADVNDDGMYSFGDVYFGMFHSFGLVSVPPVPAPHPTAGTAPLKPLPVRSHLDELKIDDGELVRGHHEVIQVKMTTSSPVDGFTVSLTYDPARITVHKVDISAGLTPPAAIQPVIVHNATRGWILVTTPLDREIPATANFPLVDIEVEPIDFTEAYHHICFRDAFLPPLSYNELMQLRATGGSVRPLLNSGTFANVVPFRRGDCNADGRFDIADAVTMLNCQFGNQICQCFDACNVNDDPWFDISDPIYALNYQFSTGPAPRAPFPNCGLDPTPDPFPFCSRSSCP